MLASDPIRAIQINKVDILDVSVVSCIGEMPFRKFSTVLVPYSNPVRSCLHGLGNHGDKFKFLTAHFRQPSHTCELKCTRRVVH